MDLEWLAEVLGARRVRRAETIQRLWAGYGELFRIAIEGGDRPTAIVKWVRPPQGANDESFARKCRSYDVELAFYRTVAPRCDDRCRIARLLAARTAPLDWLIVLEDLDAAGFDQRTDDASPRQLDAALAWLAAFHARFVDEPIDQLGTYWHLATRQAELAAITDRSLRDDAPRLAEQLLGARFQTRLHGDPKEANFCFSRAGSVAAVDFQYTGRGCAMSDVAYLLYGRADEARGLDRYFEYLDNAAFEAAWRPLYPIARRDFVRFLAGWRR